MYYNPRGHYVRSTNQRGSQIFFSYFLCIFYFFDQLLKNILCFSVVLCQSSTHRIGSYAHGNTLPTIKKGKIAFCIKTLSH